MPMFRKKPVLIEAVQWDGTYEGMKKIREKLPTLINSSTIRTAEKKVDWWAISTLEGLMTVSPLDWIITGVKGEHYPCKPNIFELTYESA